jgi:hypothetical protein
MDHITDGDEISSRANILSERDHKDYHELRTARKNAYCCLSKHTKPCYNRRTDKT